MQVKDTGVSTSHPLELLFLKRDNNKYWQICGETGYVKFFNHFEKQLSSVFKKHKFATWLSYSTPRYLSTQEKEKPKYRQRSVHGCR